MSKNRNTKEEPPIPHKFAPGDRVKPTAEAIALLWTKHGVVIECGMLTVEVTMDGEAVSHPYRIEMWEPE